MGINSIILIEDTLVILAVSILSIFIHSKILHSLAISLFASKIFTHKFDIIPITLMWFMTYNWMVIRLRLQKIRSNKKNMNIEKEYVDKLTLLRGAKPVVKNKSKNIKFKFIEDMQKRNNV